MSETHEGDARVSRWARRGEVRGAVDDFLSSRVVGMAEWNKWNVTECQIRDGLARRTHLAPPCGNSTP